MPSKNYTSLVPRYTFSSTLEKQERELANNPLTTRMAESRRAFSGDPFRPIYHYVNPESTLNDPNGLCFWQGRWHLFYQGYPPEDPRQHWGHAVSDDLIHWRDLPYAIYPDPEESCFSGAEEIHGAKLNFQSPLRPDALLFGESQSRIVVSFPKHQQDQMETEAHEAGVDFEVIGQVGGPDLTVLVNNREYIREPIKELKDIWENALKDYGR